MEKRGFIRRTQSTTD
ncbi:hypothetical protein, partial [Streptomyces sp. NPDC013489]